MLNSTQLKWGEDYTTAASQWLSCLNKACTLAWVLPLVTWGILRLKSYICDANLIYRGAKTFPLLPRLSARSYVSFPSSFSLHSLADKNKPCSICTQCSIHSVQSDVTSVKFPDCTEDTAVGYEIAKNILILSQMFKRKQQLLNKAKAAWEKKIKAHIEHHRAQQHISCTCPLLSLIRGFSYSG